MLCKMKEILDDAQKKGYGVAYFNATDYHMVRAYIKAAEALRSPVIIGTSQGLVEQYGGFECSGAVTGCEYRLCTRCSPSRSHLF